MQTDANRLKNMREIYDYFLVNPGKGLNSILEATGALNSTMRYRINLMVSYGYLLRTEVPHYRGLGDRYTFTVGRRGRPDKPPKIDKPPRPRKSNVPDKCFTRKFSKAVQVGMVRDELVAALFGHVVTA